MKAEGRAELQRDGAVAPGDVDRGSERSLGFQDVAGRDDLAAKTMKLRLEPSLFALRQRLQGLGEHRGKVSA